MLTLFKNIMDLMFREQSRVYKKMRIRIINLQRGSVRDLKEDQRDTLRMLIAWYIMQTVRAGQVAGTQQCPVHYANGACRASHWYATVPCTLCKRCVQGKSQVRNSALHVHYANVACRASRWYATVPCMYIMQTVRAGQVAQILQYKFYLLAISCIIYILIVWNLH